MLKNLILRFKDFFIPPLCIVCDGDLADERNGGGGGDWLCPACINLLVQNHKQREACPRCAINRKRRECACEAVWDLPFERVFCVCDYDDTLSVIAKHIKYYGKSGLAERMGFISASLIPKDFFSGVDFVIPVPLHPKRRRWRGYNQAEFFARGVLRGLGIDTANPVDTAVNKINTPPPLRTDLLIRVKNTKTQTRLDRDERRENLSGAFAVNVQAASAPLLSGARAVLVDDIFTTGATTEACAETLLGAGCASVAVLAMGRD
jgi:ComF family protein